MASDSRWREIDRIFTEALEADPADWEAIVRRAAGSDIGLSDAVWELLNSAAGLGTFLETPAQLITADFLEQILEGSTGGDDPYIGRRIGAYRVTSEIDRGGMGTVYLARRDDEHFDRQVAIKILRTDREASDVVARFLAERQILASLNHRNIAQLIDGGETADGRPYIVM